MPLLDVTEVLTDPDFATTFTVRRRAETVGSDGRSSVVSTDVPNVVGVITPSSPSDLVRNDDGQMIPRVISVITKYRLRAASAGVQPDVIVWRSTEYTIHQLDSCVQFGEGFVEALATSMAASDVPLENT